MHSPRNTVVETHWSRCAPRKPSRDQEREKMRRSLRVCSRHAPRNPLGVQLLAPSLRAQLFPGSHFSGPPPAFVQISRDHLSGHSLDPSLASSLPSTSFSLPPLQGNSLPQHFHSIGLSTASPYRSLALDLAHASLPPPPDPSEWNITQSGWTKYHYRLGGASFSEPVPYPAHDGVPESMLVFDVETMPKEGHPYPVIAIAASSNAWYAWISPWLLGESSSPAQLISFGPDADRLIVGHNVSFDRARVQDEYSLSRTRTRWMDTMSLHVAVNGISSHQRPAWNKWKKKRETEKLQKNEAVEAVIDLIARVREEEDQAQDDPENLERLKKVRMDMEESLRLSYQPEVDYGNENDDADDDDNGENMTWEALTSANSLVDVARLHCGIELEQNKAAVMKKLVQMNRSELMPHLFPPDAPDPNPDSHHLTLTDLLAYCATDVHTTHQVYRTILPSFLSRCPHPVSFSGVLTMGSSFLTVNGAWDRYIDSAERVYRAMEERVKKRLLELAASAKQLADSREWEKDPWLSQFDWTLKKAGKSRGVVSSVFLFVCESS